MRYTAVIMAGGKGERFWPKSRSSCPKQFLSLTPDGMTMIQKTVQRLSALVLPEDIYIVTNQEYLALVKAQLPDLPAENCIAEPCPRNTAPCIALAASVIAKKYKDAVMFVLPSDHLIQAQAAYLQTLRKAAAFAEQGEHLVTLGITPAYAETGYGYIQYQAEGGQDGIYPVKCFVEKPDAATAQAYLDSGAYLWNSGMFIWKASSILKAVAAYMPELAEGLQPIAAAYGTAAFGAVLQERFPALPSESIDFGIMEKAENIYTIPGEFGWDDVGSWLALERMNPTDAAGNYTDGDMISLASTGCTVCADKTKEKKLIALLGVQNLVVVDTADALLICDKQHTQDIRDILTSLREQGRTEVL